MAKRDERGTSRSAPAGLRCEDCRHKNPGHRYKHFLDHMSLSDLEDHLTGQGFPDHTRASIVAWYETQVSTYVQQAKSHQMPVSEIWRHQTNNAHDQMYTVRDQQTADRIVQEWHAELAEKGIGVEQAVEYAQAMVYRYLNANSRNNDEK